MTSSHEPSALSVRRSSDVIVLKGRVTDNAPHAHHAMQLVWGHGVPARLRTHEEHSGGVLIVESGTRHELELSEGMVILLEPKSRVARALRDRWLRGAPVAVAVEAPAESSGTPEASLRTLVGGPVGGGGTEGDPRVARVLRWLDDLEQQGRWPELSLGEALSLVNLSESRFRHLFSETVGSPWRSYLVWRRALVAMTVAARGLTLTEAAHAAGYADSAHLSRQFKGLFGFTPSRAVGFSRFVQG